ncbi:MAG: L,D-transpeptidase [Pyrinomonadaceae bacterium]
MKKILRAASLMAVTIFALAGCVAEPTNTANTANTNAANANTNNSPAATNAPAANAGAANTAGVPVTLPVVDAMFADESFAGELKSKLQLTDEQVEKLRSIAREQTATLRENGGESDDYGGSTSAASRRADEQIKSVLGEEKARQFAAFVRERWGSGGSGDGAGAAAGLPAKPNSIPTDTRIVVNAPAYRMDVFENGKLTKTYKVGIGYPEFPLPTGLRKADTIIFNPTWTPPDEPWVEAPDSKVKPGQKVEAGSKLNPLGLIKIPIGLPSLIHGGKSAAKLGTFASHGCVGLTNEKVQDFAQVLAQMSGTQLSKEDVLAYAKNRTETRNVKLGRAVPVELRYETIVVEDGRLRIFRDVYDHGTNTEDNLRAVLEAHGVSLDQLSEQERARVTDALRQMARDATGKPADGAPSASPTPSPAKNTNANGGEERVTRSVKGQKEITIELAALQGKGYPAPAGMDDKGSQKKGSSSSAASSGRRG